MATQQLPTHPARGGLETEGYTTPSADKTPQKMSVPPRRVLPIIFLPGIMGSNLRLKADQSELQRTLGNDNNIAWRPDDLLSSVSKLSAAGHASPARRQSLYDPLATEVDTYDPVGNPTGNPNETADQRHSNVALHFELNVSGDTPLLMDDPPTKTPPRRTRMQKARERGWGEVFFGSYGELLQLCEVRLNTAFRAGKMDRWWLDVVGVDPQRWQRGPSGDDPAIQAATSNAAVKLKALTMDELKLAVQGCWFPVHAMGYNWLESNKSSGIKTADRIRTLIEKYQREGYVCEKVIVVTHSMGGLVARALIHPDMGNLKDQVLGMIHGVMPAIGAGTAYKRIRAGFEGMSAEASIPGNFGDEVTAVLGNSQGGLELLPSQAYGNDWLRVVRENELLISLPKKGDPYEEIYKLRGKWYGLLREDWLNPALHPKAGYPRTAGYLDEAKAFHDAIGATYHDVSYAHYGADPAKVAWRNVTWEVKYAYPVTGSVDKLVSIGDNKQGRLSLGLPKVPGVPWLPSVCAHAELSPAQEAGDKTVPVYSADHQLRSGKFKAVFRQEGYEHQGSYSNSSALASTLYCLVRIAQKMTWSKP